MFFSVNRPNRIAWIYIVIFALMLNACAAAGSPTQAPVEKYAEVERQSGAAPAFDVASGVPAAPEMEAPAPSANVAQSSIERIVIKNGSLTIVVADPPKTMTGIMRMAEEMGGFVVSSNMYKEFAQGGIEVPRGSVTIRVPAGRMLEAMERIKNQSTQEPINENTSSQDVTNEYVDLQSRLKNLEAAEVELTAIMQEAKRTEDVLSVYNQLVQIREQIEVIKGQIKYYEESAALSSISVELIADQALQPIEIGGWQPQGVVKDAVEALLKTMQFLVDALIWIGLYLLPVLTILFVIFVLPPILIIRWAVRRNKRKKQAAQPPQA